MSTAVKEKTNVIVPPFGIEISTPRNGDMRIQGIPGCTLRGAIKARATCKLMPMMPEVPGMQLHVNPAECAYTIIDPLYKNDALCEQIRSMMEHSEMLTTPGKVLSGVPPQNGKLDVDRMKTLCREMLYILDSDHAVMVKGPKPDMVDVEELPGDFLLNPGSGSGSGQPRYEKDMPAYERQLGRAGE